MAKQTYPLTPEQFWNLYAKELNEEGKKEGMHDKYKTTRPWTKYITDLTSRIIESFYEEDQASPHWKISKEYFKVDLIGYLTEWENPDNVNKQHNWEVKIAYEHENDHQRWHDELCKLCHIVADLRVLASYHVLNNSTPIIELLQEKIDYLGKWKLLRVPNSSWLFIFGPLRDHSHPFQAFSIDSNLKVFEIESSEVVIPKNWH